MSHFIYNGKLQPQYQKPTTRGWFKVFQDDGKLDFMCEAISGGGGRGHLPSGRYGAFSFEKTNDPAMSRNNLGFFIRLLPQFETDRTNLLIHFDGGKLGSLGCIALLPQDKKYSDDEVKTIFEKLQKIIACEKIVPLTVA